MCCTDSFNQCVNFALRASCVEGANSTLKKDKLYLFCLFSLVSTRYFDISYVKKIRVEKGVSFNTKCLKLNLVNKLIIMPGYFLVKD